MLSYQNSTGGLKFPVEIENFRRIQELQFPMNADDEFNMITNLFEESDQEQTTDLFLAS